jgi:hypothetical protein
MGGRVETGDLLVVVIPKRGSTDLDGQLIDPIRNR